eukprot:GHVS01056932.1.p1 GENE.GHVS01056932.1~~GHVS01056932.1.p1  ORF type:complete len:583 (-),score=107.81 GHVS01056932.1:429-2177(-)
MRPQYRFIREVGRGASGSAQLMEDGQGTHYIMKSIQTDNMKEHQLRNAINEIKILNELRHPFIVRYRESFIENGALNIIMDFCSGGDLSKRITRQRKEVRKKFKESEIVCWLAQAVMALSDMHKRHIMHRDLKPLNIFLDGEDGRMRLGDFGISKQLDCTEGVAHTFVGTPHYMSPEVVKGSKAGYGNAADIWSLGCVLYELCTFKTPYHNAYPINVLIDSLLDPKAVPSIPAGYYSSELIALCDRMLQKDPKKRPSTQELLKAPLVQAGILGMLASPTFHGSPQSPSPFVQPPPPARPMQSLPKLHVAVAPSPRGRLSDSTASSDGSEQRNEQREKKGSPFFERTNDEEESEDSVICYRMLKEASLEEMPDSLKSGGRKKAESSKGKGESSSGSSSGRKDQKENNNSDSKENMRNNSKENVGNNSKENVSNNSGKSAAQSSSNGGNRARAADQKNREYEQKKLVGGSGNNSDISRRNNITSIQAEQPVAYPASAVKRRNAVMFHNLFNVEADARPLLVKPQEVAAPPAKQSTGGEKRKDGEKRKKGKEGEEDGEAKVVAGGRRHHHRSSEKEQRKEERQKA